MEVDDEVGVLLAELGEGELVLAGTADEKIVAEAAGQDVAALAAIEFVVAAEAPGSVASGPAIEEIGCIVVDDRQLAHVPAELLRRDRRNGDAVDVDRDRRDEGQLAAADYAIAEQKVRAGTARHGVRAEAADRIVVALIAGDEVVAVLRIDVVEAGAAEDHIVAAAGLDLVVAAVAEGDESP